MTSPVGETGIEIRDGHFGQFEEFAEAFQDAGWEAEYLQLARGRFHGRMLFTASGSSQIAHCTWQKKIRHNGLPPKGTVALGVTLSQCGDGGRYMGAPITPDDVIVNPDTTELDIFAAPTWEAAVFVIPKAEIRDQLATLTQRDPEDILRQHSMARLPQSQSARLRRACQGYFRATEVGAQSDDRSLPLSMMAADLSSLAIRLIAEAELEPLPKPGYLRRLELIRKSEEYVRSCPTDALRIPDLCRHLGTSERSLRYAFADLSGTSPAAYLKAQRLSRVHEALRRAEPGETLVKTVAYQHGFWHLGQFTQDYRRLFGERASETLAASNGNGASKRIQPLRHRH